MENNTVLFRTYRRLVDRIACSDFDSILYDFHPSANIRVFYNGKPMLDSEYANVPDGLALGPSGTGKRGDVVIVGLLHPRDELVWAREAYARRLSGAADYDRSAPTCAEKSAQVSDIDGTLYLPGGSFRDLLDGLKESDLVKGTETRSDGGTLTDLKTEVDGKAMEAAIKSLDRFVDVAIALKKWPGMVKLQYDVVQQWKNLAPTIATLEGKVALPYRFTGVYGDKVETGPAHWPERIDVHKNGWGEAKEGDPSRGFFYIRQDLYDAMGNDFSECETRLSELWKEYSQDRIKIEVLERNQEPYRQMLETMCVSYGSRYEIFPDGSYRLENIFREGKLIDKKTHSCSEGCIG
jgi:hypothetical protein